VDTWHLNRILEILARICFGSICVFDISGVDSELDLIISETEVERIVIIATERLTEDRSVVGVNPLV